MPGNYTDDIFVNYWEVDYRRLFRAWQGQFDFRAEEAGLHEYVVDDWTSNQVTIWDISDPSQPRWLTVTKGMAHKIYLPLISSSGAVQTSVSIGCVFGQMMSSAPATGCRKKRLSNTRPRSACGTRQGFVTRRAAPTP